MASQQGILLISNMFSIGASYGGVCKELATQLAAQGWNVTTTSRISNRYLRPLDMLLTALLSRNQYHIAQIDVFSGPAFRWAELCAWLLRRLNKPFVLILRGGNLPNFAQINTQRVSKLLQTASEVTTPSRYLLQQLVPYRQDMRLIPNPIDIKPYTFRIRSKPEPKLLYLRAFHQMYNPALAISIMKNIVTSYPSTKLTMVGPDKDGTLRKVQDSVEQSELGNNVEIVGAIPKSQVPEAMNDADIFINTTNVDNTPISIIEAMASGLCIVSTNVGGIPYLLEDEHDALLVPPNDPEAMAKAVRRILTEPGLAEKLSRNARAKAETFDWSVILPQWEALLTEVIEKHG